MAAPEAPRPTPAAAGISRRGVRPLLHPEVTCRLGLEMIRRKLHPERNGADNLEAPRGMEKAVTTTQIQARASIRTSTILTRLGRTGTTLPQTASNIGSCRMAALCPNNEKEY